MQDFTSNIIQKVSSWIEEFDMNALMIKNTSSGTISYNPTHPYANPQRNLESKDCQSLIELLLDTNSTAKDIDSLLHSFPHYLQDSKQLLESNNTESNPTQSNAESTTTTTKSPKESKESTTPTTKDSQQTKDSSNSTPNNNQTTNTFPFSLQIKDYNTFVSLSNKQIQITNIDSKQIYTQTTKSK